MRHEEAGLRYVYAPVVPRHAARRSAVKHLIDTFFDGSAAALVTALIGSDAARMSDEDLAADRTPARGGAEGSRMTGPLDFAVGASLVLLVALSAAALLGRQSAASRHLVLAAGLAATLADWPAVVADAAAGQRGARRRPPARTRSPIEVVETADDGAGRGSARGVRTGLLLAGVDRWHALLERLWLAVLLLRAVAPDAACAWMPRGMGRAFCRRRRPPWASTRQVDVKATDMGLAPATWGWRASRDSGARRFRTGPPPASASCWCTSSRTCSGSTGPCSCSARPPARSIGSTHWCGSPAAASAARANAPATISCSAAASAPTATRRELADIARLHHAGGPYPAGVVPMARPSSLERRIVAMLDPTDRSPSAHAPHGPRVRRVGPCSRCRPRRSDSPRRSRCGRSRCRCSIPRGAVLPGTTVELVDAARTTRSATTEGSGRAVFDEVPPGDYTISASLLGFRHLRAAIAVGAARDRQRSITLQVGELTETVTVRERRPPPAPRRRPAAW